MAKINRVKETFVSQELLKELLRYEYETGLFYWIVSRCNNRIKAGQIAGYKAEDGYVQIGINGHTYQAHRLAWIYIHGDFPNGEQPLIDHVNGKKDDNRLTNLKISSHGENQRNMKMNSNNTSGVTGVTLTWAWNGSKNRKMWYWEAFWCDENCKSQRKKFSIGKLGDNEAKQAAVNFRTEQIRLLEVNFGITYSERHGT